MKKDILLVVVSFLFGQAAMAVCPGQVTATQDSAIVLPYEFEATGNPIIRHIYTADHIGGPYTPMGIISEIAGNSNTTHPAIVQFKDRWIFFSHNGALPDGGSYSRSIIAEPLSYDADGRIRFIPATSQGALQ